jgi:hypothetical protein
MMPCTALLAAEMLTGSDGKKDTTIRGLEMGSVPPRSANTLLLCAAVTLAEATRVSEPTTSQPRDTAAKPVFLSEKRVAELREETKMVSIAAFTVPDVP